MKHLSKKERGSALMMAMMFVVFMTMLAASYMDLISSSSIGRKFSDVSPQAFYAAEAGAYRLLDQMNSGGATSLTGSLTNVTGTGNYSASYDASTGVITSTGSVAASMATATRTVSVRTKLISPYIRGAISVNGNATLKDNAVCDGRDHDSSGNLTGGSGTYGVSSTGAVVVQGSAKIGGNGIAPANPANSSSYQENASAFASTDPWDIMGVTKAWFDANVTATTTAPTAPWSGIVYYTPSGDWEDANLNGSSGILIVHNTNGTARIRDMNGTFKGLIIADKFRQEKNNSVTILGAVNVCSVLQNKGGNMNIHYSSQVLTGLSSLVGSQTSGWKKVIVSSSWQESQ